MLIGVIMGGISSEREISLKTGEEIIKNLDKNKYDIVPLIINTPYDLTNQIKGLDFAFLALHGKFGEDGSVQAMLESNLIPYTGSGVLSSALCMDKNMCKRVFKAENIDTPDWIMINNNLKDNDYDKIYKLGYPVVIKPNNGGSSIGASIVRKKEEVKDAVMDALKYDSEVMVEKYIKGSEITCCILNGVSLPIISIKPKSDFFDYTSKYDSSKSKEIVITFEDSIQKKIQDMALKCYNVCKCKAYGRVDMILQGDKAYVLEMNTLPGLTENSLFPKSAKAVGMDFKTLLDNIIKYSENN